MQHNRAASYRQGYCNQGCLSQARPSVETNNGPAMGEQAVGFAEGFSSEIVMVVTAAACVNEASTRVWTFIIRVLL